MWQMADPEIFILIIPLTAAAWFVFRRRKPGCAMVYPPCGHLPPLPRSGRIMAANAARAGFVAGAALTIFALARPQTLGSRVIRQKEIVAIQMTVDVSGSMAGLDFSSPEMISSGDYLTRLDVVKKVFTEFVGKRPNDLIGLITFGGYATSLVPLTFDHQLLKHVLDDISIPSEQYDGHGLLLHPDEQMTAVGDALALACARFNDVDIASRIVVFLSDGESNFGIIEPAEAILIARNMGVRVYTIAVGTDNPVPFLAYDALGRGTVRHTAIAMDYDLLQRMAEETGGNYYHVKDTDSLEMAMRDIDILEKTPAEFEVFTRRNEKMAWPLTAGLFILLAAVTLSCALNGEPS